MFLHLGEVMAALLVFLPQVLLCLDPVLAQGGQQLLPDHRSQKNKTNWYGAVRTMNSCQDSEQLSGQQEAVMLVNSEQ